MPILIVRKLTIEKCRADPQRLFVFGDNWANKGKAGQAVIRGEPNAVGIFTKKYPSMEKSSFLTDNDFDENIERNKPRWDRLYDHLDGGAGVVWPYMKIGTGMAMLKEKAPKIFAYLEDSYTVMCGKYGVVTGENLGAYDSIIL